MLIVAGLVCSAFDTRLAVLLERTERWVIIATHPRLPAHRLGV
ncbi:MAG: hypothetical protein AB9883_04945 [Acidaminococcaceae bacterium]